MEAKIKKHTLIVDVHGEQYPDYRSEFLGISQEDAGIDNAILKSRFRDQFKSSKHYRTTYGDILKDLREKKPDILHIACPTKNGNLLFVSGSNMRQVTPEDLADKIKKSGSNTRLVVLRAFGTKAFAEELSKKAGLVVLYMKNKDSLERCSEFLQAFYELLGNGMTLSQSFELAKCVAASRAFELVQPKRNAKHFSFIEHPTSLTDATIFASTPTHAAHALPGLTQELDTIANYSALNVDLSYPAGKREIVMKLAYTRPALAHFASHAGPEMVLFYSPEGSRVELEKYWLTHVMEQFKSIIHCLILNSCENGKVAYRLSKYIDYVVGTKRSVFDMVAVEFTDHFYASISRQAEKNYARAFALADSNVEIYRFLYRTGNDEIDRINFYELFEKSNYDGQIALNGEDRMLATEEQFLDHYGDVDELNIHVFKSRYENWYQQLCQYPGMETVLENLLKNFTYYSQNHVHDLLKRLFGYLMNDLKDTDPGLDKTIFCPLPSQGNRINSSFEYWTMFHLLNEIEKSNCKPYIEGHEDELAQVENIVFIDDFAGSGNTFINFMTKHAAFFRGKKIYYLTVHMMEAGRRNVEKAAKELKIGFKAIYVKSSKKAFQIYPIKKKQKNAFITNCQALGISPDRILGYGNTEALCAFYNNVPNNNLGIFCERVNNKEGKPVFLPLFERQKAHKKAFEKPGLVNLEDKILDFYQKSDGSASFEELMELFHVDELKLAQTLNTLFENGSLTFTDDNRIRPSNARKIVVFGGSFNPPTLAHKAILTQAVETIGADYGMFVPSSNAYVAKKMIKSGEALPAFSENLRVEMLEACAGNDPYLLINQCELGDDGAGHSYDTMKKVQKTNPNATLYYLIGADKLDILSRWHHIEDFLQEFHFAVVKRKEENPLEQIHADKLLSKYEDRFIIIDGSGSDTGNSSDSDHGLDLLDISSSEVRKALILGDDYSQMLHPEVAAILRKVATPITSFRDDYFFLSNFYEMRIAFEGMTYRNAEAAFQAQKCKTMKERQAFTTLTGAEAKKLGQTVPLREDWEESKLETMHRILETKFQNMFLQSKLKATGNSYLIEGNDWNDTYWGMSLASAKGENHLGKLLMAIRKSIISR